MGSDVPQLCGHCAAIDFSYLRLPTAADLRRWAAGQMPMGEEYPFKIDQTVSERNPAWDLGTVGRIAASAATCAFCAAIVDLAEQHGVQAEMGPALWSEDVQVVASSEYSGYLLPQDPMRADPVTLKYLGLKHPEDVLFHFRSLGLWWRHLEAERTGVPGVYLGECFQAYDPKAELGVAPLFDDAGLPDDTLVYGGRQRPPVIDTGLLQRWLHECLSEHGPRCGEPASSTLRSSPKVMPVFRLLDVRNQSVVRFIDADLASFHYVALSYVWGSRQRLTISHSNVHQLGNDGALSGKVSQTIADAIALTDRLGIRYLWVDALCIIQDDTTDQTIHVGAMSEIYRNALLTIIAAAGEDAEAGLAGLDTPRPGTQRTVRVEEATADRPALELLTRPQPTRARVAHYLDGSVWSTRGWTLQERAISRRTLTLTARQAYWSCRRANWAEDVFGEAALARTRLFSMVDMEGGFLGASQMRHTSRCNADESDDEHAWTQLQGLTRSFSARHLSLPGDVYDAFSAICQESTHLTMSGFLWALPTSRFELALCWRPDGGGLDRRSALTTLPVTSLKRRVPFPSWSWIGWAGAVRVFVEDKYVELGIDPQILVFVLRNNPPRLARVSRITASGADPPAPRLPPNFPAGPLAVTLETVHAHVPELTPAAVADVPDDQLLFFWTYAASFAVRGPMPVAAVAAAPAATAAAGQLCYQILDADGAEVGRTETCPPTAARHAGRPAGADVFEFVLLAANRAPEHPPEKIVLQVVRAGGVARRVNIAQIRDEAWAAANPEWKLIALG